MQIAIDGPAGSGKGTIAKIIAEKLGYIYIDTGAMYRCVALKTIKNNISEYDNKKIIEMIKDIDIKLDINQKVYLDNIDVTSEIRSDAVNKIVYIVSKISAVRDKLIDLQRNIASNNNVVMEGRDITTVVLLNADFKFYLDASVSVRANRRYKEELASGMTTNYDSVLESIKARDTEDMNRPIGALKRVDTQIYIDSSDMTIDEVVSKFMEIIKGDNK